MVPAVVKVVLLGTILALGDCQKKDGFTDENRPYEFGFTIEGEQHRYEKKDEKGIIMGEYGFITADGVYHVTVYATDENGNFRILKTRNIRIGLKKVQPVTSTTSKPTLKTLNGLRGCSGCLIPTTTKPPLPYAARPQTNNIGQTRLDENPPIDVRIQNPQLDTSRIPEVGQRNTYNIQNKEGKAPGQKSIQTNIGTTGHGVNQPGVNFNQNSFQHATKNVNQPTRIENYYPNSNTIGNKIGGTKSPESPVNNNQMNARNDLLNPRKNENLSPPERNSNKLGSNGTPGGTLSDTEKRIMDFMANLYKFNYTLTFHGHEEEGDISGNKRGSYFNNGRDGYQRKVVYLANEFGYQPTISLVKLDEASTPNEVSEKDLTELKGNEFIWFYDKLNSTKYN